MSQEFTLSINSIKNVPFDKYNKDFTFIVDNKEYKTSRFVADLLSPIICKYHDVDESMNTFEINTNDHDNQNNFSDILSLISFEPQKLEIKQKEFMQNILLLLGNEHEYFRLTGEESATLNEQNIFEITKAKLQYFTQNRSRNISDFLQKEIEFISKNFYELESTKKDEIKKLPIEIIEEVVKNKDLKLNNEDQLLKFIIELTKENDENSILYDYVEFKQVSDDELINFMNNFSLDFITNNIFKNIIGRSIQKETNQNTNRYIQNIQTNSNKNKLFECEENQEFNGIIKYLTEKTGGNIHDNGTIEVKSNNYSCLPKNLLDFNKSTYYLANSQSDIWINFDFKEKKVKLTNYSIQCYKTGTHQLRSWVIEVSNDNKNWKTIDEHKDDQTLKNFHGSKTFKTESNEFYQHIRLRQTSEPWGGNNLWFHYIEFYGYLQE